MAGKGFGSNWRTWSHGCLVSSHFLIRPRVSSPLQAELDKETLFPLSSSQWLPRLLAISKNGEKNNLIQGFQVGKEAIPISHLQYADDTLLFLDGGKNHLINLISLIHCFE